MNCRTFERRIPDWLAGRLSPDDASPMEGHRTACAACAGLVGAEERLREAWRADGATMPSAPDLWPRLSTRLEEALRQQHVRTTVLRGRLALGVASLALAAAAGLLVRPGTPPPAPPTVVVQAGTPMSAFSDVSRVDPTVDDPVGTMVDEEWQQIHTASTRTGAGR